MSLIVSNKHEEDGVMNFKVSGINLSIANALRRTVLADIQSICLENINILMNDSCLNDEVLKQRISYIPVKILPEDEYKNFEISIDIQNNSDYEMLVTTENIKVFDKRNKENIDSSTLFPPDETGNYIEIVKLKPISNKCAEKIKLSCTLEITSYEKNSVNSVVCTSVFSRCVDYDNLLKIYKEKYNIPDSILIQEDESVLKRKLNYEDYQDYIIAEDFEFEFESIGSISNSYIIKKALSILINRLVDLSDNITLRTFGTNIDINILENTYTIGNMLLELIIDEKILFKSLIINKDANILRLGFGKTSSVYKIEDVKDKINNLIDIIKDIDTKFSNYSEE